MKRQITRFSVLQTSKVLGILYVFFGLIYVPFGLGMIFLGGTEMKIMGIMYTFMPILMGVFGFIGVVIFSALYNLVARWIGGIEVEVTDTELYPQQ